MIRGMWVFAAAVVLAACGFAQGTSIPLSGTLDTGGDVIYKRFTVDHGGSATAVDVDISLTTAYAGEILIAFFPDWNRTVAGLGGITSTESSSGGALDVSVTSFASTGVQAMVLWVTLESGTGPGSFAGTIDFSVAGVTTHSTGGNEWYVDGEAANCGVIGEYTRVDASGTQSADITLDAGASSQTIDFTVVAQGVDFSEIRIYDVTSGEVLLGTYPASGGMALAQDYLSVTHSGLVKIRVVADGGVDGYFFVRLTAPSTAPITAVATGGSVGGGGGGGGGGGDKDGGGCSVTPGGGTLWLSALVALLALAALRRRGRIAR